MSDLVSITARLNAATPGPWRWRIYPKHHAIELTTDNEHGRLSVMDFVRWGMQNATPRFNVDRFFMKPLQQLPDSTHPDAELIAHAPEDISYLLERVGELEAQRDAVLAIHRRGMVYTSGSTDPKHKPSTEFRCTDDHLLWPCATVTALGGTTA